MRISRWMLIGLATALVSLSLTTGVLAAEGDTPIAAAKEQDDLSELDTLFADPNLTVEEREALTLAAQEFNSGAGDLRGAAVQEGRSAGAALEGAGNLALGAPELGGGTTGKPLTAREQALMKEVSTFQQDLAQKGLGSEQIHNQIEAKFGEQLRQEGIEQGVFTPGERDDFQLRELYNQGVPVDGALEQRGGFEYGGPAAAGLERGMFESGREFGQSVAERARTMEHGSFSEGIGREGAQGMERGGSSEGIGREGAGGTSREQAEKSYQPMERDSNAQGREHGQRETEHRGGGSEREQAVERPTYEREHSTMEHPTYEREQPTMERPTYEREQPTMEHPTYEREQPTMEHPTYEREQPTMEHPAYEVK